MDQDFLVKSGRALVTLLTELDFKPRVAMLVSNPDTGGFRMWIMPPKSHTGVKYQNEVFRKITEVISKNRDKVTNIDVSDIDLIADDHPAMLGMRGAFRVTKNSTAIVRQSSFNGYFLPEAIILEMDL